MQPAELIKKAIGWGLVGLLGAAVLAYAVDAVRIRYRLSSGGAAKAYGTVVVMPAVALKGEKYEVYANNGTPVTCAQSLFPQLGDPPCWYVRRHQMDFLN
jgi:hypothetical protein